MTKEPTDSETNCAGCPFKNSDHICMNLEGKHPENCPTAQHDPGVATALEEYAKRDCR
jgi:hypothetical protein